MRWWQSRTLLATLVFLGLLACSTVLALRGVAIPRWVEVAGPGVYAVLVGLLRVQRLGTRRG